MESRIRFAFVATILLFAAFVWFETGTFLFPFGLFKIGLLISFIASFIAHKPRDWKGFAVSLLWLIPLALPSNFVVQLFVSEESLVANKETLLDIQNLSLIVSYVGLFVWHVYNGWRKPGLLQALWMLSGIGFSVCLLGNFFLLLPLPMLLLGVVLWKDSTTNDALKTLGWNWLVVVTATLVSALFFKPEVVYLYL